MRSARAPRYPGWWVCGVAAMLAACAAQPPAPEPAAATATVPAEVADALLPTPQAAPKADAEPRFDIHVHEAPARGFFMSLVDGTRYNMLVQPEVKGDITLDLKDVTVPEVMVAVHDAYGYEYRASGTNGFVVLGESLQSRIFQINYLNLRRQGKSTTRISSGQLTDSRNDGSDFGSNSSSGSDSGSDQQTVAAGSIQTDSTSDLWEELDRTLKLLVPTADGRSIVLNRDSGLVVVRAMPSELRLVERFLAGLQDSLGRQVILEAKILEVQLNDQFQAGINWALVGDDNGHHLFGGLVGGQNVFNTGNTGLAGDAIQVNPGQLLNGFTSTAIGGAFIAAIDAGDFNAVVELLRAQGDVQVLSSPRVATMNNQKAIIKVGSDEFFVTGVKSNTTTGAATNTNREVQLTPFFSGVALDVTPEIDEASNVTLHVHPLVSQVQDQTKTFVVEGQRQVLPLALSNVRETDSIVQARSGQVVVIGGLMQQTDRDQDFGLPVLSNIPVIGNLFKQQRKGTQKSELVILLRPLVSGVASSASWNPQDHLTPRPPPIQIP